VPKVERTSPGPKATVKPASNPGVSAWDLVDTLRVLLYGRSGTGKTTTWATFPGPIRALICSGGNKPGELKSIKTPEYMKKITPVIINSSEQFRQELADIAANPPGTTVLDHASGFMDLVIMELLGLDKIPVGKSRIAGKGESWSLVSQQQYGQLAIIVKDLFRDLLNLPGNVVIVAQERTFGGKDDGGDPDLIRPTVGAALTPGIVSWLNPACDYVLQTYIRPKTGKQETTVNGKKFYTDIRLKNEVEYCVRTEPHDVFMTKFRVPKGHKLPECIVNPDYQKIMDVITGKKA
jgi:hypothetical protein